MWTKNVYLNSVIKVTVSFGFSGVRNSVIIVSKLRHPRNQSMESESLQFYITPKYLHDLLCTNEICIYSFFIHVEEQ